jgi:putative heme transporter
MAAGGVVLVATVFGFALPRLASYRDVLDALSSLSWPEIVALVVAVVINLVTFAPPWMAALPGLGFLQALTMTQASQAAASTLPGGEALGVALSVGMLRGWGFPAGSIAVAAVLVSVWNTALKVAFPLLALGLLALGGGANKTLEIAGAAGLAALLVGLAAGTAVIWSDRQAHRVGEAVGRALSWLRRRVRRPPVTGIGDRFVRFRNAAIGVLRRRWHVLTLATIVGNLAVFAVLLVCLRSLGVSSGEVSTIEAFAAWSLMRLLTAIPITPGGIGIVELGLSGALIAFGGADAEVVAAVLLFRLLTWAPSILVGVPCALLWKRMHPLPRKQEPAGATTDLV